MTQNLKVKSQGLIFLAKNLIPNLKDTIFFGSEQLKTIVQVLEITYLKFWRHIPLIHDLFGVKGEISKCLNLYDYFVIFIRVLPEPNLEKKIKSAWFESQSMFTHFITNQSQYL
jgi:hypothetical protein